MDKTRKRMSMTFAHAEAMAKRQSQRTFRVEDIVKFAATVERMDPAIVDLLNHLLARPRNNHNTLSDSEKTAFNSAVQASEADGTYANLVAAHSAMTHRMHSIMGGGFIGGMRFLPWHRVFLALFEGQLQSYDPNVTIPYWDWANDHTLPGWVYLPPGVTRGPDVSFQLPTQVDIDKNVLSHNDYVGFTISGVLDDNPPGLESYHNAVHMWVGGTMQDPMVSPHDPLFWLHHSNVDRIWAQWQSAHPGVLEPLSGLDALMDPWSWFSISSVNDTYDFRYFYA